MPDRHPRTVNQHPGPGIPHHLAYLLPPFRRIAVNGAFGAEGLFLSEGAGVQPAVGISFQFVEFQALFSMVFLPPAVDTDHLTDHFFLPVYPVHLLNSLFFPDKGHTRPFRFASPDRGLRLPGPSGFQRYYHFGGRKPPPCCSPPSS